MTSYGLPQLGYGAQDPETLKAQYEYHRQALWNQGLQQGHSPQAVAAQLKQLDQQFQQQQER